MRKLQLHITVNEYCRLRQAAKRRGLTAWEYARQATGLQVDLDLGARTRFESDPHDRREVVSFGVATPRR